MITLPKIRKTNNKRIGRGYGSGKGGHTSGRGQKGQKSRRNLNILFEGVKMKKSFIKRLPFKRGKNKFKAGKKPVAVNLKRILDLPKDVKVINIEALIAAGVVNKTDAKKYGVKILGVGEVKSKLTVELPVSRSAKEAIEKAGGTIN